MSTAGPRFLVRFLDAALKRTHGVGFLVAEQHILTCAHVVNLALDRGERAQDRPTERELVDLEFPLAGDTFCRARVQRWEPPPSGIGGSDGADIAGLVIVGGKSPAGVAPARLTAAASAGCQVDVFGFPSGQGRPDGVWASGRVAGEVREKLLQIDADGDAAWQAQRGFSGAPVIDRASGAVLGMFKAASTVDERRDSYAIPTGVLCAEWEDVLVVLPPNPYKGLAAFTPADAEVFLGRDVEQAELLSKVRGHPLVLVVGPSGVGKSSLVQAGLIPALAKDGWAWEVCRPSEHLDDPFQALAAALRRVEGAAGSDVDRQRAWAEDIRADGLVRLAADLRVASGRRTLLVVDQLEGCSISRTARSLQSSWSGFLIYPRRCAESTRWPWWRRCGLTYTIACSTTRTLRPGW